MYSLPLLDCSNDRRTDKSVNGSRCSATTNPYRSKYDNVSGTSSSTTDTGIGTNKMNANLLVLLAKAVACVSQYL